MSSASTLAALSKMYKTVYVGRDLSNQNKRRTVAYDMVAKYDDFDGANLTFPFNWGLPTGVSSVFSTAQTNPQPSKFDNWVLSTRKTLFGFLTIDAEAMKASRKDIGAFLRLRQKETNELLAYMKMLLGGHAFWGDGAGNMGQIASVAGTNPITSFTLAVPSDAIKFHINQLLQFNPTRTGSPGTLKAVIYQVSGVNRVTGVITVTRTSGTTPDPAANDYVYLNGTYGNYPVGIQGYLPASDPGTNGVPTTLQGMTLTDDITMKSGWRVSWQGSIEESAKYLVALMGQYFDRENSVLWLSRFNWFRLEQELSAQGRKIIDARATQVFGAPALLLLTPEGDIPVVADGYCPSDTGFLLNMSTLEVHHLDNLIHIVDDDGLSLLRQTSDDGVEIRFRSWSDNLMLHPFTCGRFTIV